MPRAKSIQIYLKDGLDEDDMLLALWESCKRRSRPQVVFRRMLMKGFDAMVAEGELPPSITDEMKIIREDENLGRRKPPSNPKVEGLDVQGAEVWSKLHGTTEDEEPPRPRERPSKPPQPPERREEPRTERPSILDGMMPSEDIPEPIEETPTPSREREPRRSPEPAPREEPRRAQPPKPPAPPPSDDEGEGDEDHAFIGDIM